MIALLADIVSWILLLAGSAFYVIGAFGLLRMPDFFTRLHAASVIETLGAGLLLIGMMVQGGFTLVTLKLAFILALIVYVSPVATHALARAARHAGIEPILDSPEELPPSKP